MLSCGPCPEAAVCQGGLLRPLKSRLFQCASPVDIESARRSAAINRMLWAGLGLCFVVLLFSVQFCERVTDIVHEMPGSLDTLTYNVST